MTHFSVSQKYQEVRKATPGQYVMNLDSGVLKFRSWATWWVIAADSPEHEEAEKTAR